MGPPFRPEATTFRQLRCLRLEKPARGALRAFGMTKRLTFDGSLDDLQSMAAFTRVIEARSFYPSGKQLAPKVSAFVSFLARELPRRLGLDRVPR